MQEYARVLTYAIPLFMLLIVIEWGYGAIKGNITLRSFDTVSSLSSGITNTLKQVLGLTILIISYEWLYDHLAMVKISSPWYLYVVGFIGIDFAGYWTHRFEHKVNIFWNRHIIHHSSEEYNLACALRQTISAVFAVFTILLLPCALLGVSPKVIGFITPIHLFAQFWYHTRLIGKMGFWESIIVTPSHHRVHHAINDIYIDKNFGQIFIFWDKMFGTFQKELADEIPVYGVKKQAATWNPIKINFQHLALLIKDAWKTSSYLDKLRIWFMPAGWRPADVSVRYPIEYILNAKDQKKYETHGTILLHIWSWASLFLILGLMFHMFTFIGQSSFYNLLIYGCFLGASVYVCTALMDGDKTALFAELLKVISVATAMNMLGNWFGISIYFMLLYLIASTGMSIYFLFLEGKKDISTLQIDRLH